MTLKRIFTHAKNDVKEVAHSITHHHHDTQQNSETSEVPPAVSVSTSSSSLFDKVKKLENHFRDRPTGKFLAYADHLRRKFAKATEDHHFPKELANDFPAYAKLIAELQQALNEEEKNRQTYSRQELQERLTFLKSIVQTQQEAHKSRLQEYEDKLKEIESRRQEVAELKELVETTEPAKSSFCGSSVWNKIKSKFHKHTEVAKEDAKKMEEKANADKPKRSSFRTNLDIKVNVDVADIIHGSVKKFNSPNDATSMEGARGILKYHEEKLQKEEINLEKPEDLDIEEMGQLASVQRKMDDEEKKHPYQLQPETMLAVIRVYESSIRILDKGVNLEKITSHHSTDHLMKSFKHGLEKMAKVGEKFYCPAVNDFDFNHFHNEFTLLKDVDALAIIRGDASDEVMKKFMPQQPVQDQVAGVRI